jgi:transcriptional regulator with XRE-family HTH domain
MAQGIKIRPAKRSPLGSIMAPIREARGLSQSKLAERAGFDHSYVSRLESGSRLPTREAVEALATALEASEMDRRAMLGAVGFTPSPSQIRPFNPILQELDDILAEASPTLERAILNAIALIRSGAREIKG